MSAGSGTLRPVVEVEETLYRYEDAKTSTYQVVTVVVHETVGWVISVGGTRANKSAVDDLATQVMSTVEFTR